MESRQFERLKIDIATTASAAQIVALEELVDTTVAQQVTDIALARRTKATIERRTCPHCYGRNVVRHGKDKNQRQRFLCRGCGRTYNILTGTPMARARKPEKWQPYLAFMSGHMTVRAIVLAGIGVNHVTVWRWRHRFLTATALDNTAMLSGVIEADVTWITRSFKGRRGRHNRCRPSDHDARTVTDGAAPNGLPREPVPVLCALDMSGGIFQAILPSLEEIESVMAGRIATGSVLCSGRAAGYQEAAATAGAEHRVIHQTQTGTPPAAVQLAPSQRCGLLGLARVNGHHDLLRDLVDRRCRGVATKYLGNYLGWHKCMCQAGFVGTSLLSRALM